MDKNIFTKKKENNIAIKKKLWLVVENKALWLIKLSDNSITTELLEWLKKLPVCFVIEESKDEKISDNITFISKIKQEDLIAFDFIICDDEIENLNNYLTNGITPIIIKQNHMRAVLKEFNPLKNEGNSFFYEELDKWSIFYTIARYMENYKFPFDNKNLVKNVLKLS